MAPWLIHFSIRSISLEFNLRLDEGGGIKIDVSLEEIRMKTSDNCGLPETKACPDGFSFRALNALSSLSSRRPAWRLLASGP